MKHWYDIFGIIFACSMLAPMLCPVIIENRQRALLGRKPIGFEEIDPRGMRIVTCCGTIFLLGVLSFVIYCLCLVFL